MTNLSPLCVSAGSLPIRVSPSKTPVKMEGGRDSDGQSSSAHSQQSLQQTRGQLAQQAQQNSSQPQQAQQLPPQQRQELDQVAD